MEPPHRPQTLTRPKLAELIADELRRAIVAPLPPGARLPSETELAERFGTSKPTVRQALRVLESEGLVTMRRGTNGGPVVRRPTVNQVSRNVGVLMQLEGVSQRELFEARRMLEAEATRRLATAPSEAALAALVGSLDAYEASIASGSGRAAGAEHLRFHNLLLELCDNRAVTMLGTMTRSIITGLTDSGIEVLHDHHPELPWREAATQALEAHRQIVDRVRARDAEGAFGRVRAHLDRWIELVPMARGDAVVQVVQPATTLLPPTVDADGDVR